MSRDWTLDELRAISSAMKATGHMSYEEFCESLCLNREETTGQEVKAMRKCKVCAVDMTAGYCYAGGEAYYCSDECLRHDFTEEEWEEAYETGDSYWTEWEEEYDHSI